MKSEGKGHAVKKKMTRQEKDRLKSQIWKNPNIIHELFGDEKWYSFRPAAESDEIPSEEMYRFIRHELERKEMKRKRWSIVRQNTVSFLRYGAAASVLLLLCLGLWKLVPSGKRGEDGAQMLAEKSATVDTLPAPWIAIGNPSRQVKRVVLPDSSEVKLYANSSIRFSGDFSSKSREVHLSGKAFFDVKKDPSRPFSVSGGGVQTTVLGTSFTIDTRTARRQTSVLLHTGKVVVASVLTGSTFERVYLSKKGEQLLFDPQMQLAELIRPVRTKPVASASLAKVRKEGTSLIMENIPLPDAIGALKEAYQANIVISDASIQHIKYTGTVNIEKDGLEEVLEIICLINDLQYEQQENGTYIITKKNKSTNRQQ